MTQLREAGIDLRGARNATLRALVLEIPAPIVATHLDTAIRSSTTMRPAQERNGLPTPHSAEDESTSPLTIVVDRK